MEKICCFTGSRPQNLPWKFNENNFRCLELKRNLQNEITKAMSAGFSHFITGMALGVDQYAAEILFDIRKNSPTIAFTIEAALPCENQSERWTSSQQSRYSALISQMDKVTLVNKYYFHDCMQKRNEYMVRKSSLIIAVTDGRPGGTMNTITFAQKLDKQIIVINP